MFSAEYYEDGEIKEDKVGGESSMHRIKANRIQKLSRKSEGGKSVVRHRHRRQDIKMSMKGTGRVLNSTET